MPFPAGLALVTVTCQFDLLPDGGALADVRIAYDGPLTGPTDGSIVPYVDSSAVLVAGTCDIEVPATNDPDWTPQDFSYTVTVTFSDNRVRSGTMQLDYQTTAVNLSDVVQWDNAVVTPGTTYATLAQLTAAQAAAAALVDDLSGVTDASTARTNLGLGGAAVLAVGTTAGTVAAGDDSRIVGALQTTGGTVTGDLVVADDAPATKAYRLKTSGSNLDLDAAASDLYVSNWTVVDFSGTQRNYLRLESGAQLAHALGPWLFASGAFDGTGVASLDPSTGLAGLGSKNSLTNVSIAGRRTSAGPPTSSTWTAGDVVLATDGWWLCTAGGTPGTWAALAHSPAVDAGMVGWSFDPARIQGGTALTASGTAHVVRVRAEASVLTGIEVEIVTAGTNLSDCYVAVCNDAGALIGGAAITADQSTAWQSTGRKRMDLSVAQGVTPGAYYRPVIWGTTTAGVLPEFGRAAAGLDPDTLNPSTVRYATADTGLTTTPPSNLGTQTAIGTATYVGFS